MDRVGAWRVGRAVGPRHPAACHEYNAHAVRGGGRCATRRRAAESDDDAPALTRADDARATLGDLCGGTTGRHDRVGPGGRHTAAYARHVAVSRRHNAVSIAVSSR